MSLYDYIERRFGLSSLEATRAFFKAARLPEPDDGEYFASYDSGKVLFLNDEGCALRFMAASSAIPAHPGVLQPIGSRMLGDMRLDIMPGAQCMPDEDRFEAMADELEKDGFHFAPDDRDPRNGISLPDGTVLLVDPGAVSKLSRATSTAGAALYARQRVFDSLRDRFARCWPENEQLPSADGISGFMQACREARAEGTLVAGWAQLSARDFGASRKIKNAAAVYQLHRRTYEREMDRRRHRDHAYDVP